MNKPKITVVGIGYVGLSLSILLSQKNYVQALDISPDTVNNINSRISPLKDEQVENYLSNTELNLSATLSVEDAYSNAQYIIIATPTNYDNKTGKFDTKSIESNIKLIQKYNKTALIIIKSTVPINFADKLKKIINLNRIVFCPEFLRENNIIEDSLNPTRIVFGFNKENKNAARKVHEFSKLLTQSCSKKNTPVFYVSFPEASAIKLFSNAYLALRVSFFNELDTYAEYKGLSSENIIMSICKDPRIGDYYNNPSFGYGGYCLPKDSKQLLSEYKKIPQSLMSAIVESNFIRKNYISNRIEETMDMFQKRNNQQPTIGIYRLLMKSNGSNFRQSAILDVINKIKSKNKKTTIIIYEPNLINQDSYLNCEIDNDLNNFKSKSDIIIANRSSKELTDIEYKVYTRDIFKKN